MGWFWSRGIIYPICSDTDQQKPWWEYNHQQGWANFGHYPETFIKLSCISHLQFTSACPCLMVTWISHGPNQHIYRPNKPHQTLWASRKHGCHGCGSSFHGVGAFTQGWTVWTATASWRERWLVPSAGWTHVTCWSLEANHSWGSPGEAPPKCGSQPWSFRTHLENWQFGCNKELKQKIWNLTFSISLLNPFDVFDRWMSGVTTSSLFYQSTQFKRRAYRYCPSRFSLVAAQRQQGFLWIKEVCFLAPWCRKSPLVPCDVNCLKNRYRMI